MLKVEHAHHDFMGRKLWLKLMVHPFSPQLVKMSLGKDGFMPKVPRDGKNYFSDVDVNDLLFV